MSDEEAVKRFRDVLGRVPSPSDFRSDGMEVLLTEFDGGGDLRRGEIGHCAELSPDLIPLSGRAPSLAPSTVLARVGGLLADKAR